MSWVRRYRIRSFTLASLWIVPVAGLAAVVLVAPGLRWLDRQLAWHVMAVSPEGARALVATVASATLTLIVFVFSMLLLTVQIASAQLTPRIIARTFRDRVTKFALGFFVFTYMLSLAVLWRIDDRVPQLPLMAVVFTTLTSIPVFLYLIDRLGKSLRPVTVVTQVAAEGLQAIEAMYPHQVSGADNGGPIPSSRAFDAPGRVIEHRGSSGVLLAFHQAGLVGVARRADAIVALVPQVGEFIPKGEPLFRVFLNGAGLDDEALHRSVIFGPERTIEQDPAFAFRIIVDIALKALSPAINDPTTAVLAIDQIHRLLRQLGARHLDNGEVRDAQGGLRLVYPTPDWEDFVALAVSEIRQCGGGSIQVVRRLRAMLEHLATVVPPQRLPALHEELALLDHAVERSFPDPADRIRAGIADSQGVGGAHWKKPSP